MTVLWTLMACAIYSGMAALIYFAIRWGVRK